MKLKFVKLEPEGLDILSRILGGNAQQLGSGVFVIDGSLKNRTISGEPKEPLAGIFRATFDILCQELGLADDQRTVNIAFPKNHHTENGSTSNVDTDPFKVKISIQNPYIMIVTMCHEMIHVRDLATGVVALKKDEDGEHLYFRGQKINETLAREGMKHKLDDLALPHEREAYAKMWPLAMTVLSKLSETQREWIEKGYQRDILPPTLLDYYKERETKQASRINEARQVFEQVKIENPDGIFAKMASFEELI